MSRFSGKCDFCDEIEIFGLTKILNSDVYIGYSEVPLQLHCLADCVPYFPYVVSISLWNEEKMCGMIRLTDRSWVDIEADRYGEHQIHTYYRELLQAEIERAQKEGADYGNQSQSE